MKMVPQPTNHGKQTLGKTPVQKISLNKTFYTSVEFSLIYQLFNVSNINCLH
jgi:hypothetical protein